MPSIDKNESSTQKKTEFFSRPLRGGVLLIGSLAWQNDLDQDKHDHIRIDWRAKHLGPNYTFVKVPIRYGRYSPTKRIVVQTQASISCHADEPSLFANIATWQHFTPRSANGHLYSTCSASSSPLYLPGRYTMVLSKEYEAAGKLGQARVYPLLQQIPETAFLMKEVKALSKAEGIYKKKGERKKKGTQPTYLTASWGAVGIVLAPTLAQGDQKKILTCWQREQFLESDYIKFFRVGNEAPFIEPTGEVLIDSLADTAGYDFLLVTVTAPQCLTAPPSPERQADLTTSRYPTPQEVAELIPTDSRRYFQQNRAHQIETADDLIILAYLGYELPPDL